MNALINGGVEVSVILEDGSTSTWKVRQIPLREYDKGFKVWEDEIGLTALFCGVEVAELHKATPESYEKLVEAGKKVNASFFAYCERRQKEVFERYNLMRPKQSPESPSAPLPLASVPRPV